MTTNILRSFCTRRVLVTAISAVLLFSMTVFSSGGGTVRALKNALSMYDSEHGRFVRKKSQFTSDAGTGYTGVPLELFSLDLTSPGLDSHSVLLPSSGSTDTAQSPFAGTIVLRQGSVQRSIPIVAQGQYRVIGADGGGGGGGGGLWPIEMLSLDLSLNDSILGPIRLRESPTLASTGKYELTPIGGGITGYNIDSFFDVFTELSLDGGQSWQPASSSVRMSLTSIAPEPGTIALAAIGAAALFLARTAQRRRR